MDQRIVIDRMRMREEPGRAASHGGRREGLLAAFAGQGSYEGLVDLSNIPHRMGP